MPAGLPNMAPDSPEDAVEGVSHGGGSHAVGLKLKGGPRRNHRKQAEAVASRRLNFFIIPFHEYLFVLIQALDLVSESTPRAARS